MSVMWCRPAGATLSQTTFMKDMNLKTPTSKLTVATGAKLGELGAATLTKAYCSMTKDTGNQVGSTHHPLLF